jgi:hypothetical protein
MINQLKQLEQLRAPSGVEAPNLVLNGTDWVGATGLTPPDDWTTAGGGLYTVTPGGWLTIERVVSVVDTMQGIATEIGEQYTVSFDIPSFVVGACRFQINGSGNIVSVDYSAVQSNIEHTFTANSTSTTLRFRNVVSGSAEFSIDNVTFKKV